MAIRRDDRPARKRYTANRRLRTNKVRAIMKASKGKRIIERSVVLSPPDENGVCKKTYVKRVIGPKPRVTKKEAEMIWDKARRDIPWLRGAAS